MVALEEFSEILELYEEACKFYESQMPGSKGEEYLFGRGIKPETIRDFRLGAASESRNSLLLHLLKLFPEEVISQSRLIYPYTEDEVYAHPACDKFGNAQVIIPIIDIEGKVVNFDSRETKPEEQYCRYRGRICAQSKQGTSIVELVPLFYGLNLAKPHILLEGEVLIVEGYIDVIRCHQEGIKNCIATRGTILEKSRFDLLNFLSPDLKISVCFDNDEPGRKGEKAIRDYLKSDQNTSKRVTFYSLPDGEDPASIFENGGNLKDFLKS